MAERLYYKDKNVVFTETINNTIYNYIDNKYDFSQWQEAYSMFGRFTPKTSGVYAFVAQTHYKGKRGKILVEVEIIYVGSAKNLDERICGHEVYRVSRHYHNHVQCYFLETLEYKTLERELILQLSPKINTMHNG